MHLVSDKHCGVTEHIDDEQYICWPRTWASISAEVVDAISDILDLEPLRAVQAAVLIAFARACRRNCPLIHDSLTDLWVHGAPHHDEQAAAAI